jgi:dTDP-4-dehydrorhamnose 3,5-epimerase-like enzyme
MSIHPAATTPVIIEVLRSARDARGAVFEPLDEAGLRGQRNTHVVLTAPGAVRGNHKHAHSTEMTVIVGPAHVRYRDPAGVHSIDVPAGEAWRFRFPPGVAHAFKNTGEQPMVLVSFASEPHDPTAPDAQRELLI